LPNWSPGEKMGKPRTTRAAVKSRLADLTASGRDVFGELDRVTSDDDDNLLFQRII